MKHFHTLTCNWSAGTIGDQIKEAINLARLTGCNIKFEFNRVSIEVGVLSDPQKVYEEYLGKLKGNDYVNKV